VARRRAAVELHGAFAGDHRSGDSEDDGSSAPWGALARVGDQHTTQTPELSCPQAGQRRPPHPPSRDLVRHVPARLQAEGFTPGTIDGTRGPQTQHALRWFQNARGWVVTVCIAWQDERLSPTYRRLWRRLLQALLNRSDTVGHPLATRHSCWYCCGCFMFLSL
jgi:hypothetical protein